MDYKEFKKSFETQIKKVGYKQILIVMAWELTIARDKIEQLEKEKKNANS